MSDAFSSDVEKVRNEMKRYSDNQALIVSYLLGSLLEADRESIENRYLEEEGLFEELQEVEDELIDDYVSGALTPEQQTRFEQYFLRSAQRREKLEFARAMTAHAVAWKKDAESAEGPSNYNSELREWTENAGNVLPLNPWLRPVPAWRQWVALAAAVLIATGGGALWLRNRQLRRELIAADANLVKLRQEAKAQSALAVETQAQLSAERQQAQELEGQLEKPPKSSSVEAANKVVVNVILGLDYLVQVTRGGGEKKVKSLELPVNAGIVRLRLEFERSRSETFKVTVRRADGGTVWTLGGLKARALGDNEGLTVSIPADNLPEGNYELIVSSMPSEGDAELVGRYFLKLVRREVTR